MFWVQKCEKCSLKNKIYSIFILHICMCDVNISFLAIYFRYERKIYLSYYVSYIYFLSTRHLRLYDNIFLAWLYWHVVYYAGFRVSSILYWNISARIVFTLLTFVLFRSIKTKRAESHIRFALKPMVHFTRHIFSFIFPLFHRRREARICHYSEYCITSRLRNHDSMSFIFCVFFFFISLYLLRIFRCYLIFIKNASNIFMITSLNYLAIWQRKISCCYSAKFTLLKLCFETILKYHLEN